MYLTKKSLEILTSFRTTQNIQSVAYSFGTSYSIIRNNYFKRFWKKGYLARIGKGQYVLSEKGCKKIIDTIKSHKIIDTVTIEAGKGTSNKDIQKLIKNKHQEEVISSTLYGRICDLRKKHGFVDRRCQIAAIPTEFSPELAELLGLIFTDGYVYKYGVSFYNTSEALLNRFKHLTSLVFKLNNFASRTKTTGVKEISVYSLSYSKYINSLLEKKTKIPNQIMNGSKELKAGFLKGFFSGDGGVCLSIIVEPRRKKRLIYSTSLFIACQRAKIREELVILLKSLGFEPKSCKINITLSKKSDLEKFYTEISFVDCCTITTHSKNWKGFEKNQLLNYIVNSLRNDVVLKELMCSSTKEEVVKYIRSKLNELQNP